MEEALQDDDNDAGEVKQAPDEGAVEILGTPARRRRRLTQERMPDTIVAVETHDWTGVEYRFNVRWNSGRRTSVGKDRLLKGTPQERHVMLDYVGRILAWLLPWVGECCDDNLTTNYRAE